MARGDEQGAPAPLAGRALGRAAELRVLAQSLQRARTATPQVVLIDGAPGIGKTTLVQEHLAAAGCSAYVVAARPGDESEPYSLAARLLASLHGDDAGPPGTIVSDREAATHVVAGDLVRRLGELQGRHPIVVVVEDAQWADVRSLDAIRICLRRLGADRVQVLVVTRDPDPRSALVADLLTGPPLETRTETRTLETAHLRLAGLTRESTRDLVGTLTGSAYDGAAIDLVYAQTGGNPLFVRAVCVSRVRPAKIGATVDEVVHGLVVALPPAARALLEALAVLGGRAGVVRLTELAGCSDAAPVLDELFACDLVRWSSEPGPVAVEFEHQIGCDVVQRSMPPARRRELHLSAARVSGPADALAHRIAAAAGPDRALAGELEELAAGMDRAVDTHEIATYLVRAAELSGTRGEYERRLLTACLYSLATWRADWVAERLDLIHGCASSPLKNLVEGVVALLVSGDLAQAHQRLVEPPPPGLDDAPEWLHAYAALFRAALHLWRGEDVAAQRHAEVAVGSGLLDRRNRDVARMLTVVAHSRRYGLRAAADLLDRDFAPEYRRRSDGVELLACRGALRTMQGRLTDGRGDLDAVVAQVRRGAPQPLMQAAHAYLAMANYLLGAWDDASVAAEQGLVATEAGRQTYHQALGHLCATLVPAGRGEWAQATEHARAARLWARMIGSPQDQRYAAIAGAMLAEARDDHAGVLAELAAAGIGASTVPDRSHAWLQMWWQPLLVQALIARERLDEAESALEALAATVSDVSFLRGTCTRLTARLAAARGADRRGLEMLRAAADRPMGRDDVALSRGLLEHDLGVLAGRTGRTEDGRRWLDIARGRFLALGATPYALRCVEQLQRLGGTPAPVEDRLARLTQRERDVARLVAQGETNHAIAASLFVSVKTVEFHLGHIYGKLGIRSRLQLVVALNAQAG